VEGNLENSDGHAEIFGSDVVDRGRAGSTLWCAVWSRDGGYYVTNRDVSDAVFSCSGGSGRKAVQSVQHQRTTRRRLVEGSFRFIHFSAL